LRTGPGKKGGKEGGEIVLKLMNFVGSNNFLKKGLMLTCNIIDLRWVAERAGREVRGERERGRLIWKGKVDRECETDGEKEDIKLKCVILTRGGEHS